MDIQETQFKVEDLQHDLDVLRRWLIHYGIGKNGNHTQILESFRVQIASLESRTGDFANLGTAIKKCLSLTENLREMVRQEEGERCMNCGSLEIVKDTNTCPDCYLLFNRH
jgi:hypothetical protein